MGPHVFACGNLALEQYLPAKRPTLQWGRTFLRAEIRSARPLLSRPNQLQWGRTFLRAEISPRNGQDCYGRIRFNGAARFCVRKSAGLVPNALRGASFNGAARFCVRKSYQPEGQDKLYEVASMGPHVFACGNLRSYTVNNVRVQLQWGRTFLRAEIVRP